MTGKVVAFFVLSVPFVVAGGCAYCVLSGGELYEAIFEAYAVIFNVPGAAETCNLDRKTSGRSLRQQFRSMTGPSAPDHLECVGQFNRSWIAYTLMLPLPGAAIPHANALVLLTTSAPRPLGSPHTAGNLKRVPSLPEVDGQMCLLQGQASRTSIASARPPS